MREFIISTDSTCDLPQSFLTNYQISIHPIPYILDGVTYGIDVPELSPKEFYERMSAGQMPTTSACNLGTIHELMMKQVKAGYDILHISFSSGLSSTYNNACICAKQIMEEFPASNIIVVDSLSASLGQGLMVYKAAKLKEQGKSIEEIAFWLRENSKHFVHQFTVEDLFHLQRGGRISKSTAFFGTALSIKPLLHIDENGALVNIDKIRGKKKLFTTLINNMEKKIEGFEQELVCIAHGNRYEDAQFIAEQIKSRYGIENIMINYMNPAIGAHTGPGCLSIMYFGNER